MKADGIEYDERMDLLEDVSWPKPLEELLEHTYEVYRRSHPWVAENALSPKSVVRDMYERAMTFAEYVAFYGLTRSEGMLLRYLGDAYRALRQTVPDSVRDDQLTDIIESRGIERSLARRVALQLTQRNALRAHAVLELGIDPDDTVHPWHAALASTVSFTIGAILPLLTIMLPSVARIEVTVVAVRS